MAPTIDQDQTARSSVFALAATCSKFLEVLPTQHLWIPGESAINKGMNIIQV